MYARHWGIVALASLFLGLLVLGSIWLCPPAASAYHLEMAGRALAPVEDGRAALPAAGRLAGAAAHLESALRWQDENASAWRMSGRLHLLQGDLLQAARALGRYTALRPGNPAGWWELAGVYGAMAAGLDGAGPGALLPTLAGQDQTVAEQAAPPAELATWMMPLAPGATPPAADSLPGALARPVLAMDPGSSVELELSVPVTATSLFFWMGLDPAMWWTVQDGLTFSVVVNGNECLSRHLTVAEARQGWWPAAADLAAWAGQRVDLVLKVAGDGPGAGRAGWGTPQLLAPDQVAYAALAPQQARLAAWRAGGFTAPTLVAAGDDAWQAGQAETALDWYRQALALEPGARLAWYSLAALCQDLILAHPASLGDLSGLYREYVAWNGGNWLVNGGFEAAQLGWTGYTPSAGNALFDVVPSPGGEGQLSALIWGRSADYHGGWWQRLSLDAGHWYRYSARLRIQDSQGFEVRALYWESYSAGAPQGQYAQVLSQDTDWTLVEVDFQAPASEQGIVLYPALVRGRGRVWIDDVRLVDLGTARPGGAD